MKMVWREANNFHADDNNNDGGITLRICLAALPLKRGKKRKPNVKALLSEPCIAQLIIYLNWSGDNITSCVC